ncbi:acyl-CoA dehydrogenase family protein [Salinibacterium sp. TMP30]|uniref:acyl-CoA dehydrogenase family protein n=1 Tax=Salinibacterium sp. TMP30 TaxID=3138237 RepID=UPI0031391EA1
MTVLTPALLDRIRSRAARYDRENIFFTEDLQELRAVGYLKPRSLRELSDDQRLLAAYAPATALGINMHLVWIGVAWALHERGDTSLDWLLTDAEAGEVFAFGLSEPGNDLVMWDSLTTAETVEGGYTFTGTKVSTSLSPAWTQLGTFGKHTAADGTETLVHGFISRDNPGWRSLNDWDTLGMRASQSHTTVLDGAYVPANRVARVLPIGPNADPFIFAIFANFLSLIASVYAGIADRALELGVEALQTRSSAITGDQYSENPDLRWRMADAALALDALEPQIHSVVDDVDALIDHGIGWFRKLTGLKHRSVETSRHVVEQVMRSAGAGAFRSTSELARLQRDVLAGIYHPSNPESVHRTVAGDLFGS